MISKRGQQYAQIGYEHGQLNAWDPDHNPSGIVDLGTAENHLIHDDLVRFANTHYKFDKSCFSYGEEYTGTYRLRKAMANHVNECFLSASPLNAEHVTFTAGVTDLNEVCALLTCDSEGDAILLGRPNYGSFGRDMVTRTGISQVLATFADADQFSPACVQYYSRAFDQAKENGINVRALLLSNPNNPLGQCYTREALVALMEFCQSKQIHLISDEIYALSTYEKTNETPSEKFVSVLSIDLQQYITASLVHVLYGMSKDFGAPGLRLGCLITKNEGFSTAARGLCRFSSPSMVSMGLAAAMLEDREFTTALLQKSQTELNRSRRLAEGLLEEAGIRYHQQGNAGLFLWLDLRPFLPLSEVGGDGWAAEQLLFDRLGQRRVRVALGRRYFAAEPGHFRIVFSVEEAVIREGIKRIHDVCSESKG